MKNVDETLVRGVLPKREKTAHKGTFGLVCIIGGSMRYRGAPVLAAGGALRAGAGIVQVAGCEEVCAAVAAQLPCCTLAPQPEMSPKVMRRLGSSPTALLVGCGLGVSRDIARLVRAVLTRASCPVVLDADALNCLAGKAEELPREVDPNGIPKEGEECARSNMLACLRQAEVPVVLTPHVGEMARLADATIEEVAADMEGVAARFAAEHRCTVVLKSHMTVVVPPKGEALLYDGGGNPGLSKGGSGDVLAGIIAALLAQQAGGNTPMEAAHTAAAGAWLHGAAGRQAAQALGTAGMSPADLPLHLARVLQEMGY